MPATVSDPINSAILAISEDRLTGFQADPFGEIAVRSGIDVDVVLERVVAMLRAGTIRRVRQTVMSTNLARGALCAWQVSEERLEAAFEYMFRNDPFSGHVVIRSTDAASAGSTYRLWTTLKVPQGYSLRKHAELLRGIVGAERFRLMPAKMLFTLGVGHVRRRGLEPGARADSPGKPQHTEYVELSALQWRALTSLKREFEPEEIARDLWRARAKQAGIGLDEFVAIASDLNRQRRDRTLLDLSRTRQTNGQRRTRHALQRALPLGGSAGTRDGRRLRGRAALHRHPRILA